MEKGNLDAELNFIENKIKKLCGYDDESLLRELAEAEQEWEQQKAADPTAAARLEEEADKSFDLLMEKVYRERERMADRGKEEDTEKEDIEEYTEYMDELDKESEADDSEETGAESDKETGPEVIVVSGNQSEPDPAKSANEHQAEPFEEASESETDLKLKPEKTLDKPEPCLKEVKQSKSIIPVSAWNEASGADAVKNAPQENSQAAKIPTKIPAKRPGWNRKAVVLIAAVAVMAIGGGIVATATMKREYQYELMQGEKTRLIRHNTMITVGGDNLEDAYSRVGKELGISVITLGYQPKGLLFNECIISNRKAVFEFEYEEKIFYLHESMYPLESNHSIMTVSDRSACQNVDNYWLNRSLVIEENVLEDGIIEYSTGFSDKDAYYYLAGIIERDEFIDIVKNLCYATNN